MAQSQKPTTILRLGDVCRFSMPAEIAEVDCSSIPKQRLEELEDTFCLEDAIELLRHYAHRVFMKVRAITHPPLKVLSPKFKFATPEACAPDAVTKVTLRVGAWKTGAVTHVSRKNVVPNLLKFDDVYVSGNVHDGRYLHIDDHAFELDSHDCPSIQVAEEILDVWHASGGNRHTLYTMSSEEEEFLPYLRKLVEYSRSFSEGTFLVSPVTAIVKEGSAIQRELVAFRNYLVEELKWFSLSVAFCNDYDAVLTEVTRQIPADWSLLGYRGCAVHTNPAVQPIIQVEKCAVSVGPCVTLEATFSLPELVDDGEVLSVNDPRSPPPPFVIKPSSDANAPGVAKARDPEYIWYLIREVMSATTKLLSVSDIQGLICDRGMNVQRRGVRRALMAHRGQLFRMEGKWALHYEAHLSQPQPLGIEACGKCFPRKRGRIRDFGDLTEVDEILAVGASHRQAFADAAAGSLAEAAFRGTGKCRALTAPDKVRIVRDVLACDVAVARLSGLSTINGGLVGVVLKWHLPDPCAVGPVRPVPAAVAVSVLNEVILFDLDNFGNDFPPVLRDFLTTAMIRKVLPILEDVELLGAILDNEVHNTVVLGHAANYALSSDVLIGVGRNVLNATLSHAVGHIGPTAGLRWRDIASIAAEAYLTWRLGGELIYRMADLSVCEQCGRDHITYRPHHYGGSTVHEVMYCRGHGPAQEGWYALPDPAARLPRRGRRHPVLDADAQRERSAAIAFGCHREL